MSTEFHPENMQVVEIVPCGVGGGVKNGINFNVSRCQRAFIYCFNAKGADGTQTTWTLQQSSGNAGSAAGTGEKAMSANVPIYFSDGFQASSVLTAAAAGVAYQQAVTQSVTQCVVFDIVPEACMDLAGGFDTLVVNSTDPGALNTVHAIAILIPRYAPLPNALAD